MDFGNGSIYHSHQLDETELKCIYYSLGNPSFRLKVTHTVKDNDGTTQDTELYYADNTYVFIGENGGYRSILRNSVDKDDLFDLVKSNKPTHIDLEEDAFFDADFVYNEDGTMSVKADTRGASVKKQINSLIADLEASLTEMGMKVSSITVNNVEASFIITSRGYVLKSEFTVDLDFVAKINSVKVTANSKTTLIVETKDPGQPVTISFPNHSSETSN